MKTLICTSLIAGFIALAAAGGADRADIVVGLYQEPPHLDPTSAASGVIDQVVYANLFEGLVRIGPDGSVRPGLAESWIISNDGTAYIFLLHEGVHFHDGTEMDARDVKFTLDRARDERSQNSQKAIFGGIETVEVLAPLTVSIRLRAPDGRFLSKMALGDAVIVAPESIGEIKSAPVGTGPFRFKAWVPGHSIELDRNPVYWGAPARLEAVTFRFITGHATGFGAMMTGEVDVIPAFESLRTLPKFEADPRFQVLVGSTEGETILAINNGLSPFGDIRVRRAIAHAIDRTAVIDKAMFGLGTPIGTHFAPHDPDYIDLTARSTYDPALAMQLLTEAGYENGFETTLKLPPPGYARRTGHVIAAQLAAVGIKATVTELDWPAWTEEVFTGRNYDLTVLSHSEPFDIGIYAQPEYYFHYDNVAFQALMARLEQESDPQRRSIFLKEAQTMLATDYVNAFLFQLPAVTVADARLRGMWTDAPTQATDLTAVYWEP